MTAPIPQEEFAAARAWRLRRDLTMDELKELIGYSVSAISWFERGLVPPKPPRRLQPTPVTPRAWQRYKMLCEAVDMRLQHRIVGRRQFQW